ncbi:MAG: HEPN domain-containing protein [Saprospiraceae bacterium]
MIRYRIDRACESLEDSQILVKEERWNAAANRMYYACFYIVSAYLVLKGLNSATHSGLKSAFNKELILTGKIDKTEGVLFNKLFSIRQQVDYEDFTEALPEEIKPLIPKIKSLISDIEALIRNEIQ